MPISGDETFTKVDWQRVNAEVKKHSKGEYSTWDQIKKGTQFQKVRKLVLQALRQQRKIDADPNISRVKTKTHPYKRLGYYYKTPKDMKKWKQSFQKTQETKKYPKIDKYLQDNIDKPNFEIKKAMTATGASHGVLRSRIEALGFEDKERSGGRPRGKEQTPEMKKFREWLDKKVSKGETTHSTKSKLITSYGKFKPTPGIGYGDRGIYGVLQEYDDVFKFTEESKHDQARDYLKKRITNKKGTGKIVSTAADLIKDFKAKTNIDMHEGDIKKLVNDEFKKDFDIEGAKERWDKAIKRVAQELKIDPDANEVDLARQIYGADNIKNLKHTRADVSKYSEFLVGARDVAGLKLGNYSMPQKQELLGHIFYPGMFKFGSGLIGDRMLTVRDYLLKPSGRTLKSMLTALQPGLGKNRIDIDEVIGRAATYEKAPGYTELGQVLKSKITVE